mgnify:CR=1 FL=1
MSYLKKEDLEKLAIDVLAHLQRNHDCEYGSIGTDCKRPFGNSDVEGDILEIIGQEPSGDDGEGPCWSSSQREYAAALYDAVPKFIYERYVRSYPRGCHHNNWNTK